MIKVLNLRVDLRMRDRGGVSAFKTTDSGSERLCDPESIILNWYTALCSYVSMYCIVGNLLITKIPRETGRIQRDGYAECDQ